MVSNAQPPARNLDHLSDVELRQHEIPVTKASRRGKAFVPPFPLGILLAMVTAGAEKALPTVLAIHRQLHMTSRESTPLNSAIWKAAGSPGAKARAAILRKLRGLPGVIRFERHRTVASHYRVARGDLWQNAR